MTSLYSKEIALIGCSFRTLPVELRERLAVWRADAESWLQSVIAKGLCSEGALISTCNRFEFVLAGSGAGDIARFELLKRVPNDSIYHYTNREAVRHLYKVAASLDSQIVGESQILGQVKTSYERARTLGLVSKYLHQLFQGAFSAAKKVRNYTEVADYGVSVSYVAVQLARQMFGPLTECSAVLIGGGEVSELVALHLGAAGCKRITVANRTVERAAELAARYNGCAASLDDIPRLVKEADIIVGSISIDRPILEAKVIRAAKRTRPLFLIDLGMPRNFSEAVKEVSGVYLSGLDDLTKIIDKNRQLREEAALEAGLVIDYGVHQFERWLHKLEIEPHIISLRDDVRFSVQQELAIGGLEKNDLERISHRITERITHSVLKRLQGNGPID